MAFLTTLPKLALSSARGISSGFILQRPHFPDGFLDNFPKVSLVLGQGDQLRLHLCADGLNDSLDFFRKVEVEPEHLVEDESPLLQVQHDVVTHLVCVCDSLSILLRTRAHS